MSELEELRTEVERLRAALHHYRDAVAKSTPPYDYGTRDERAAVVAWLRGRRDIMGQPSGRAYRWAEAIERGDHRREGEP